MEAADSVHPPFHHARSITRHRAPRGALRVVRVRPGGGLMSMSRLRVPCRVEEPGPVSRVQGGRVRLGPQE
jgi:hypothetical protein